MPGRLKLEASVDRDCRFCYSFKSRFFATPSGAFSIAVEAAERRVFGTDPHACRTILAAVPREVLKVSERTRPEERAKPANQFQDLGSASGDD